jgi:hypothetical protein
MSDVKIDSNLVRIDSGTKTVVKEQPRNGAEDLPQLYVTIDPGTTTAKEMKAQLAQLRVNTFNPWVAEQDVTSVKISPDISEPLLKHILLWPLREMAYKIGSYVGGGPPHIDYKRVIEALFQSKQQTWYTGLVDDFLLDKGFVHRIRNSIPVPNIFKICLCLDSNTLPRSEYRPQSISDNADQIYYSIKPWSEMTGLNEKSRGGKPDYFWPTEFLNELLKLKPRDITYMNGERYYLCNGIGVFRSKIDLLNYFASFGRDKKGIYLAVYDVWDFKIGKGTYSHPSSSFIEQIEPKVMDAITKPIYIYDRYYIPEKDIESELERRAHEK